MKQKTKKWLIFLLSAFAVLVLAFALYSHFCVFNTATPIGALRKEVFHSGHFYSAYVLTLDPATPEDVGLSEWGATDVLPDTTVYKITSHIPVDYDTATNMQFWLITKADNHYSCELRGWP